MDTLLKVFERALDPDFIRERRHLFFDQRNPCNGDVYRHFARFPVYGKTVAKIWVQAHYYTRWFYCTIIARPFSTMEVRFLLVFVAFSDRNRRPYASFCRPNVDYRFFSSASTRAKCVALWVIVWRRVCHRADDRVAR